MTFEPIVVQFQQRIVTTNSQNKTELVEDDDEGWIVVTHRKGRQPNFIQKEPSFRQKHAKGSIYQKIKGKINKKMWKPKRVKEKDEDFCRHPWSTTLIEFLPESFFGVRLREILKVIACHVVNITEVDNNYASSKEIDNSNEIKQMTSVFDRIKPSTTRFSDFQRLNMATKEENQCPTSTSTLTSAFKRLSISPSKKDQPSTSIFYGLKMTSDHMKKR